MKVIVSEWWDVFSLTGDCQAECPDCDALSPPMDHAWSLVQWISKHHGKECPASKPC